MTESPEPQKRPRPFRKWTGRLCIFALLVVIGVTVWFRLTADENPYATLLLFGPRWVALVPVAALALLSVLALSLRGLLCCLFMAGIIAGPFMGYVPPSFVPQHSDPGSFRLMTFNADNKAVNKADFLQFLESNTPAVVALQDANPVSVLDFPTGWQIVPGGNGIQLASKYPVKLLGQLSDPKIGTARGAAKYLVSLPSGDQTIVVVHLPTPRHGLEAVLSRKPDAMQTLQGIITQRNAASRVVRDWIGTEDKVIMCGDFNLPVESTIYQRDWSGFRNAFATAGEGWGYTMFSKQGAVRIDHVLCNARVIQNAVVGPDLGSAHRPVIVDFGP
ncbi:hypothetical protein BH11PLA2_BH11PLA2_50570 [soil metagenome]